MIDWDDWNKIINNCLRYCDKIIDNWLQRQR